MRAPSVIWVCAALALMHCGRTVTYLPKDSTNAGGGGSSGGGTAGGGSAGGRAGGSGGGTAGGRAGGAGGGTAGGGTAGGRAGGSGGGGGTAGGGTAGGGSAGGRAGGSGGGGGIFIDAGCNPGMNRETFETLCDGFDNDCDGLTDAWRPQNLSNSPNATSRRAVAVRAQGNTLLDTAVLWEEGQKVMGRIVRVDGSLSTVVSPSITAVASARNFAPALAVDGQELVGAWIEEVVTGGVKRGVLASLNPATASSTLTGGGAIVFASGMNNPTEVAVAVDVPAQRVLVAWVDNGGLSISELALPLSNVQQLFVITMTASSARRLHASRANPGRFWLTWEDSGLGQIRRCLVESTGMLACNQAPPVGRVPSMAPLTTGAQSFFLQDLAASTATQTSFCNDAGVCSAPNQVGGVPVRPLMDSLRVAALLRDELPRFIAWDENAVSFRFAVTNRPDAGAQSFGVNPGRRPQPAYTAFDRGIIVFDTELVAGQGIAADEVFAARYCF